MGFLFRKRLRLSKWLSLNLSKSGVGLSVGPPGAKLSMNATRARMQLGIPGTGVGYRKDVSLPQQEPTALPTGSPQRHVGTWVMVGLLLALLLMVWLLAGCGFPEFRDQMYRDVMAGRLHVDPAQVGALGVPSDTIQFYDIGGRHVGYGKVGR